MENQATKMPMVLVIEPDPLLLTGISAILDRQGYRCFLARDMFVAKKAIDAHVFDLVLLATDQEIENALNAARELRANPTLLDVPIIFLASRWNQEWTARLQQAGGVFFLSKPVDPETLLQMVDRAAWLPHLVHARHTPPQAHFLNDWVRLT